MDANRGHEGTALFIEELNKITAKRRVLNALYEANQAVDATKAKDICVRLQHAIVSVREPLPPSSVQFVDRRPDDAAWKGHAAAFTTRR